MNKKDSGCGSIGNVVASDIREICGSNPVKFYTLTVNCNEKTEINKNRQGMAQFLKILMPQMFWYLINIIVHCLRQSWSQCEWLF